jgi:hypothetical protein
VPIALDYLSQIPFGYDHGTEGGVGMTVSEVDDADERKDPRLPLSVRLSYGAPSFAGAAMAIPIGIHLTIFYSNTILVPLGFIALVCGGLCDVLPISHGLHHSPLRTWTGADARLQRAKCSVWYSRGLYDLRNHFRRAPDDPVFEPCCACQSLIL